MPPRTLKVSQLKYWAFLTGHPSSMSKPELLKMLHANLPNTATIPFQEEKRIVSVDMGIRNLAFCAIRRSKSGILRVERWRKMDLIGAKSTTDEKKSVEAFTPKNLSGIAWDVVQSLLSMDPDAILIERQRFRSGGMPAVQEWTLRVNMLESMLWAVLESLRRERKGGKGEFPSTHAVHPTRVAGFWTMGEEVGLRAGEGFFQQDGLKISRGERKREVDVKRAKIDVVRRWVAGEGDVRLEFVGEAAEAAEVFRNDGKRGKIREAKVGKLDDLADCLLQGVAWLRWEENWWDIARMWEESNDSFEDELKQMEKKG